MSDLLREPPLRVVLDTNVVLDWLAFDDPHGRLIGQAITSGDMIWIATPAMREEHADVLGRPAFHRSVLDADVQGQIWERHCHWRTVPPRSPIRCADPDDQMFVDLAVSEHAAWLLTRDKALLALATPLEHQGIEVLTPAQWTRGRLARHRATA